MRAALATAWPARIVSVVTGRMIAARRTDPKPRDLDASARESAAARLKTRRLSPLYSVAAVAQGLTPNCHRSPDMTHRSWFRILAPLYNPHRSGVMRSFLDQYDAPENRLTHPLGCCLERDGRLLRRFTRPLPHARSNFLSVYARYNAVRKDARYDDATRTAHNPRAPAASARQIKFPISRGPLSQRSCRRRGRFGRKGPCCREAAGEGACGHVDGLWSGAGSAGSEL